MFLRPSVVVRARGQRTRFASTAVAGRAQGSVLRWARVWAWAGLALVAAGPQGALAASLRGSIRGQGRLVSPVWAEARAPGNHRYSFREPVPTIASEFRRLYPYPPREICVVALGGRRPQPVDRKGLEVLLVGGGTRPGTVVVGKGTRLRFSNREPFARRPFAVDNPLFSEALVRPGGERTWTARQSGTIEFRDAAAPSMRLWVVVPKQNVAATAFPSAAGEFRMDLPPGQYVLEAYFAGERVAPPRAVAVRSAGLDLRRSPLRLAQSRPASSIKEKKASP